MELDAIALGNTPRFSKATFLVFTTCLFWGLAGTASAVTCEAEPTDMAVAYGELVDCDIGFDSDGGETDLYRFSGNAGDRILAEAIEIGSTSLTPRIQLIAPDGTEFWDANRPARINMVLPQTGTYTAVISDYWGSYAGEYSFTVTCLSGVCPSPPPPPPGGNLACETEPTDMTTQFGDRVVCDITPGTETDLFRFSGSTGDRILAEAIEIGSTSLTPRIRLIAPDGTELRNTNRPAQIRMVLPQTGTYTAVISDYWGSYAGEYAYTVSCTGGSCLTPNPLPSISLTLTGCELCQPGDWFTVEVNVLNLGTEAVPVEAKLGLRQPDGATTSVLPNPHFETVLAPGMDYTFTPIDTLIQAGMPEGIWSAEGRLLGIDLGETIGEDVRYFQVTP